MLQIVKKTKWRWDSARQNEQQVSQIGPGLQELLPGAFAQQSDDAF